MDKYDELCERLEDWKLSPANLPLCKEAIAAIRELKARLEIDPRHSIDGIAARDETIRMLEGSLAAIEAAQSEDVQKCVDYVRHEAGDRRAAGYDGSAGMFEKIAALLESLAARNAELFEQVAALTEERDWYSTANERAERAESVLADAKEKNGELHMVNRELHRQLAKAERKGERLKFHAEAMADCVRVMLDSDIGAKWIWPSSAKESATQHMTESLSAYRADFPKE